MLRKSDINDNINFPQKDLIKTKKQILDMIFTSSFKEISDFVLQEATRLTESEYCYVAYVDPENKDSVGISFTKMTPECDMYEKIGEARFPVRKDGTYGGLLGYSLDTGESFYTKNIASHPVAHGLPDGHVPVEQFLSVPVITEDQVIGQIVLSNPEIDYNEKHLEIINQLAEIYSIVLEKFLKLK